MSAVPEHAVAASTGISEAEAFDLVCYLVSSAELAVIEPDLYGTFRLVDAASRLLNSLIPQAVSPQREVYERLKTEIDDNKMLMVWDHAEYIAFLRRLPLLLVEGLRLRAHAVEEVEG